MNVLALLAASEVNGPCRGLFQLVEHAKDLGLRFVLGMFLVRSFKTSPAIEEAKRRGLTIGILSQNFRYDLTLIYKARKLIRAYKITALQSHGYKAALVAWCLRWLTGVPWIAFAHGYTSENRRMAFYNYLDQWLLKRADRVLVVSNATGAVLQKAGVPDDRIRVVRNAIDPSDYRLDVNAGEFRRSVSVADDELLVGVIGRLSPEKGHKVFIRAFRQLANQVPKVRAVIVGEGPELETLKTAIREADLEKQIHLAGYIFDTSPIYAALDLVVIPSLSEGLPNVLLEAMLFGKAVVTTAVGGVPEVLQDNSCGVMVPPGNSAELAQAMIKLAGNPEYRKQLGQNGQRVIHEGFSPSSRARQIVALYQELMGQAL
jgi:glycosyltransferase involved in cell wall biosynthesis